MNSCPCDSDAHRAFVERCPSVGAAWGAIEEAGRVGPLDDRTSNLVSLGIAIGAFRQDAVRASLRKALSSGVFSKEIEQVVVLAAATMGPLDAATAFGWIRDASEGR